MNRGRRPVYDLADTLLAALRPVCARAEIAGSLRRGKTDPTDIELVCIPLSVPALDLFGEGAPQWYDLNNWVREQSEWELDRNKPRNGPRYKRLMHLRTRLCCDLFITDPDGWGVIFTLRTGPANFSAALVTLARGRGLQVDERQLWQTHRDNTRTVLPTPTEESFFAALGVPYLPPKERTLYALNQVLHKASGKGKPSYGHGAY